MLHRAQCFALSVVVLFGAAVSPRASSQELRWVDERGRPRTASNRKDVPSHQWTAVSARVHGQGATSGERFTTAEGAVVVLEGIQAPVVESDGTIVSAFGETARARLEKLVQSVELTLEFDGDRQLPNGDWLAHAVLDDDRLIAEVLLEEGLVRLCLEEATRHAEILRAAQAKAKAAGVGVWSRKPEPIPADVRFFRGNTLGLWAQNDDFDYGKFVDEMKELGTSHAMLSVPHLMEDWQSTEFGPVKGRTASWPTVDRVSRQVRARGMGVAFLPLVLLRTGNADHWRGDITPKQLWLWFRNYTRYMGIWADISHDLGAALLCVGSEFSSLEENTGAWKAVIANVRSRFAGRLTYSANWDHLTKIKFWHDLDIVGMTGYHSLTNSDDPSDDEIYREWVRVRTRLLEFQKDIDMPILFTEIGYPSQDGCNKDPWNYYINTSKPDVAEQAACFRAYIRTWSDASPAFMGMFLWNWWRNDDRKDDVSYSIWNKPAWDVLHAYYDTLAKQAAAASANDAKGGSSTVSTSVPPAARPESNPSPEQPDSRPDGPRRKDGAERMAPESRRTGR